MCGMVKSRSPGKSQDVWCGEESKSRKDSRCMVSNRSPFQSTKSCRHCQGYICNQFCFTIVDLEYGSLTTASWLPRTGMSSETLRSFLVWDYLYPCYINCTNDGVAIKWQYISLFHVCKPLVGDFVSGKSKVDLDYQLWLELVENHTQFTRFTEAMNFSTAVHMSSCHYLPWFFHMLHFWIFVLNIAP